MSIRSYTTNLLSAFSVPTCYWTIVINPAFEQSRSLSIQLTTGLSKHVIDNIMVYGNDITDYQDQIYISRTFDLPIK